MDADGGVADGHHQPQLAGARGGDGGLGDGHSARTARVGAGRRAGRLPWLFALTASLFVLSRQLSPVFLVCIVVCLALAASPGRLRALLSDRSVRLPAAFTTLATVVGAAWFLAVPPGASAIDPPVTYEGRQLLSVPLGRFGQFYQQMIGVFGWLDTRPPLVVLLVWTMAVGALVVLGVTLGAAGSPSRSCSAPVWRCWCRRWSRPPSSTTTGSCSRVATSCPSRWVS